MSDEKNTTEPSGASGGYPAVARRYVLLGGEAYYAAGGFNDFISSHDTLDAATAEAARLEGLKGFDAVDWWHIWDCVSNSVVAKSDSQAYGASDKGPTLDELRDG